MTPKIATCCYCGTRAALTLTGRERHELACSNCGAPLREMKMLRRQTPQAAIPARFVRDFDAPVRDRLRKRKKKKNSKSLKDRFMEEVFDAAEDFLDFFD